MASSVVRLGPNFFANELRVYKDWPLAWTRENFQNSVDAGAKTIDITTTPMPNDILRVKFEDDGVGMDRQTLENVYFVLGETTKDFTGSSNAGGFGKARILTCFSQAGYELRTRNLVVKGKGSEYTIEETDTYQKGVKLTVDVILNRNGVTVDLVRKIQQYLYYSYLPCKVFINGERWTTWTYNRNHRRSLSFGEVYTNSSKVPGIIVRVNGTMMFTRYSTADTQVVVEINPSMSRQVLLANRDGLAEAYQDELDSFITEIQIDKKSAFRPKKNKSFSFNGTGTFKIKRKPLQNVKPMQISTGTVDVRFLEPATKAAAYTPIATSAPVHDRSVETEEGVMMTSSGMFDILVEDDDVSDVEVRRVIERWYPSNWSLAGEERIHRGEWKVIRKGVENYKLVKMWKVACEEVLTDYVELAGADEVNWGVGFVFSERAEARNKQTNGIHYLLLNPVCKDGTMKYSIRLKDDMVKLVTLAVHEACHVKHSYHDESFATMMTELTVRVMQRLQEILNRMKDAKEGV